MIRLISFCYNQVISIIHIAMKSEVVDLPSSSKNAVAKKVRTGRWSQRQVYLFESLLERYGKNWRKIHEHMKQRSLSQIRSHAQKYFEKIGPKRVQEFEKRAKLLEAYEILKEENRDKKKAYIQESTSEKSSQLEKESIEAKIEHKEEQIRSSIEFQSSSIGKQSEIIKLQAPEFSIRNQVQAPHAFLQSLPISFYPYDNPGFLCSFLCQNRESFLNHGFSVFIDNPQFHTAAPSQFV